MPSIGGAKYQAVFLVNGQTYFGRYTERFGPYAKVEDAFYIQQTRGEDPEVPPEQRLVRRGTEPHQPLRIVLIPKSAILFVEDLQPTSPIASFMEARP